MFRLLMMESMACMVFLFVWVGRMEVIVDLLMLGMGGRVTGWGRVLF